MATQHAKIQTGAVADSGDLGAGTTITYNHTMENQAARCVIVMCVGRDTGATTSTATYGGVTMTVIYTAYSGGASGVTTSMFLLVAPPIGVNSVAITHSGSTQNNRAWTCGFWNVDQTTPQDVTATSQTSSATGGAISFTITPTTDRCMVVSAMGLQQTACTQSGDLVSLASGSATATGTVFGNLSAKEIDPAALATTSSTEVGRISAAMVALRPRRRKIRIT